MSQQMAGVADVIAPGQVAPASYWRCHSCAPRPYVLGPEGNRAGRKHMPSRVAARASGDRSQSNGQRPSHVTGSARSPAPTYVGNWPVRKSGIITELAFRSKAQRRTAAKHQSIAHPVGVHSSALLHHQDRQLRQMRTDSSCSSANAGPGHVAAAPDLGKSRLISRREGNGRHFAYCALSAT